LLEASWWPRGTAKSTRTGHDSIKLLQAPLFDQIMRKARVVSIRFRRCDVALHSSPWPHELQSSLNSNEEIWILTALSLNPTEAYFFLTIENGI